MSHHGQSVTRETMKTAHVAVQGGRHFRTSQAEPKSIQAARDYGVSIGIHPEQLHFGRFMGNPFDQ